MWKVLPVLAACLLVVPSSPSQEEARKDLKKLVGTWQMTSRVLDGKETPADAVKKMMVTVDADGSWKVLQEGVAILSGKVKLDPSKDPRAADWAVLVDGEEKGKPALAIYEVDGDTFKHCYSTAERPLKFESKEGSGVTYAVFKRVKK